MQGILFPIRFQGELDDYNAQNLDRQIVPIPLKDGRWFVPYSILENIDLGDVYWGRYKNLLKRLTIITFNESDIDNGDPDFVLGLFPV